jgi:hypothetical protein
MVSSAKHRTDEVIANITYDPSYPVVTRAAVYEALSVCGSAPSGHEEIFDDADQLQRHIDRIRKIGRQAELPVDSLKFGVPAVVHGDDEPLRRLVILNGTVGYMPQMQGSLNIGTIPPDKKTATDLYRPPQLNLSELAGAVTERIEPAVLQQRLRDNAGHVMFVGEEAIAGLFDVPDYLSGEDMLNVAGWALVYRKDRPIQLADKSSRLFRAIEIVKPTAEIKYALEWTTLLLQRKAFEELGDGKSVSGIDAKIAILEESIKTEREALLYGITTSSVRNRCRALTGAMQIKLR